MSELAAPTRLFPEGISGRLHGVRGALQHDVGRGRLLLRCHEAGPVTLEFGPAD